MAFKLRRIDVFLSVLSFVVVVVVVVVAVGNRINPYLRWPLQAPHPEELPAITQLGFLDISKFRASLHLCVWPMACNLRQSKIRQQFLASSDLLPPWEFKSTLTLHPVELSLRYPSTYTIHTQIQSFKSWDQKLCSSPTWHSDNIATRALQLWTKVQGSITWESLKLEIPLGTVWLNDWKTVIF